MLKRFTKFGGSFDKGFTIVEIMIAAALSMIIIIAALSVMIASHKAYQAEEDQSYVQQVARSVIDFISADLMRAGLGCVDQGGAEVIGESWYVFPVGSSNSSSGPDVLLFQGNDGALTYSSIETNYGPGSVVTFNVMPGTLSLFSANDKVFFFSIDRIFKGDGIVQAVDESAGTITINVNSTDITGSAGAIKLDENDMIVKKPKYIMYSIQFQTGSQAGDLLRCDSDNYPMQCPCNGAQNCQDAIIASDIEDFQVSVMLDGDNAWRADFDFDNMANADVNSNGLEDRKEIRALKIEVLVRGPAMMDDYTGPASFQLGNHTIDIQGDEIHHVRQHMSSVVVFENMSL